jgi:hypothetical protein
MENNENNKKQPAEKKIECAWNRTIDTVKEELNRYGVTNAIKEYIPNELVSGVDTLKNNETTKGLLNFISYASNKNTLQLNLLENRNITYQDRRNFVL